MTQVTRQAKPRPTTVSSQSALGRSVSQSVLSKIRK